MKISKYKKLLKCCPALYDSAVKTANNAKNDKLAQVTAYVTAPVLFCYVKYILDCVSKQNISRIYFLSRDGYILKQIADIIIAEQKLNIETRYLYVSRYSLRNALYFKCDTTDDFERAGFFGHCAVQSAENTLKRAGIDKCKRIEVYEKVGFIDDEKKILNDAEYNDFCEKLKSDRELFSEIKKRSETNYNNIIAYFEQNGLFENINKALVDSGWLGSVQRTMTELIKDKTDTDNIIGFYFGLYREKNDKYNSFLFDISDADKYVPTFCNNLFECFCSAPHGMTTGYKISGSDNNIIPLTDGTNPYLVEAAEIQIKTAETFTQNVCRNYPDITQQLSKKLTAKLLYSLMYKPDAEEAATLGSFPFCDDATEISTQPIACDCGKSIKNILFIRRIFRKKNGTGIYPDKGMYWLYGSIVLTNCKPQLVYRSSVRLWEKLRLLREKRKLCR